MQSGESDVMKVFGANFLVIVVGDDAVVTNFVRS